MREQHQIKEVSDAAAFGSFASEVVLAVDRVRSGNGRPSDPMIIGKAAELLESLITPQSRNDRAPGNRSFSSRKTTRSAMVLSLGAGEEDHGKLLASLVDAARALAAARTDADPVSTDGLIKLFARLADLQLSRSTDLLTMQPRPSAWTATQPA